MSRSTLALWCSACLLALGGCSPTTPTPPKASAALAGEAVSSQDELLPITRVGELRYAGQFDAIGGGYWHTNTPDGLFILYHSQAIPSGKLIGQNVGRFRDETLDRLLGEARRSTDPARRQVLYREAQQRLSETVPAVPSVESQMLVAYRKAVGGLLFDGSHNVPLFTSVWLAKEQP